jgi:hypothetical protein
MRNLRQGVMSFMVVSCIRVMRGLRRNGAVL